MKVTYTITVTVDEADNLADLDANEEMVRGAAGHLGEHMNGEEEECSYRATRQAEGGEPTVICEEDL